MKRSLLSLLLLLGVWSPAFADEAPLTAMVLTARSELADPYFKESVVLVMSNIGPGPAGVILNRPTPIEVAALFPDLDRATELDGRVYLGGPVSLPTVSFLFRAEASPAEHVVRVIDGVYLSTNLELLRTLLMRDDAMAGLRIFIGYTGWAPGQLEAEIARGDWNLGTADADAIFSQRSERPWPDARESDGPRA